MLPLGLKPCCHLCQTQKTRTSPTRRNLPLVRMISTPLKTVLSYDHKPREQKSIFSSVRIIWICKKSKLFWRWPSSNLVCVKWTDFNLSIPKSWNQKFNSEWSLKIETEIPDAPKMKSGTKKIDFYYFYFTKLCQTEKADKLGCVWGWLILRIYLKRFAMLVWHVWQRALNVNNWWMNFQ